MIRADLSSLSDCIRESHLLLHEAIEWREEVNSFLPLAALNNRLLLVLNPCKVIGVGWYCLINVLFVK